jgi:hypothetical protein
MAAPVVHTKTLAAASANNICASQTPAGAGALTINGSAATGGVATLDTQRRVLVTTAGAESGKTMVISGTTESGTAISETVALPNAGTVATTKDFLTVTSAVISAAAAAGITIGTNASGSTPWRNANTHLTPFALQINSGISGSVTYSIETTQSDYLTLATTVVVDATSVAGTSAASTLTVSAPVRAWRTTVTAGTGTVTTGGIQAGIANY